MVGIASTTSINSSNLSRGVDTWIHMNVMKNTIIISINRHTIKIYLFFFNDTAPPEIYTLSLHDALPICLLQRELRDRQDLIVPQILLALLKLRRLVDVDHLVGKARGRIRAHHMIELPRFVADLLLRSEEHTSELQSRLHLVCRLLLEKKN